MSFLVIFSLPLASSFHQCSSSPSSSLLSVYQLTIAVPSSFVNPCCVAVLYFLSPPFYSLIPSLIPSLCLPFSIVSLSFHVSCFRFCIFLSLLRLLLSLSCPPSLLFAFVLYAFHSLLFCLSLNYFPLHSRIFSYLFFLLFSRVPRLFCLFRCFLNYLSLHSFSLFLIFLPTSCLLSSIPSCFCFHCLLFSRYRPSLLSFHHLFLSFVSFLFQFFL